MSFQNVQLDYGNFSFGPDYINQIYSINHITGTLIVKQLNGTFIKDASLDGITLQNEILELIFDGMYFWTLSNIGLVGSLGRRIMKWKLIDNSLEKQNGVGSDIILLNNSSYIYDANTFCVQKFRTTIQVDASAGATQVELNNVEFLNKGDSIYLGPNDSSGGGYVGEIRERVVTNINVNTVYFKEPLDIDFYENNQVIYRKNIWMFNNYNHSNTTQGSLIQIDSYKGYVKSRYSSAEWQNVTAATSKNNGDLMFIRASQLLTYRPSGNNAGYQSSFHLNNISYDKTTLIEAVGLEISIGEQDIDTSQIYKLQKKRRIFNSGTKLFEDEESTNKKFEIESEIMTPKITSLTAKRDTNSIMFGKNDLGNFTIRMLDQYNIPVSNRTTIAQVTGDSSGFITVVSGTTNIDGEVELQYNSGPAPSFIQPLIVVRDVVTSYNVQLMIDQKPYIENISTLEQISGPQSKNYIEQLDLRSLGFIIQSNPTSHIEVEQIVPPPSILNIVQDQATNDIVIEQKYITMSGCLIQQYGDLSNFTTITQYNFLFYASPLPDSEKNPVNTNIILRLAGYGTSLNPNTLIFKVNGIDITQNVVITQFEITPTEIGLQLFYDPPINFPYSSTVTISVSIQDNYIIPRTIEKNYVFYITADYKKPVLFQAFPPNNSIDNLPNTLIYGIIKDLETGINIDSIEMYVEGRKVNHISTLMDIDTIKVLYIPEIPFAYQSEVSVSIYVKDYEDNALVGSWSFYIKDSSGVLFINMNPEPCSVLVPTDSNICSELYGLEDGLNLKTLEFSVEGKKIIYLLKPKIFRVE